MNGSARFDGTVVVLAGELLELNRQLVDQARRQRADAGRPPHRGLDELAALLVLPARPHADNDRAAEAQDSAMTTREAARALGVSRRSAARIAPELGGVRHGRDWLIPAAAVRERAAFRRTNEE
ncbi:MAG: helix-turn-helix domain-containing protein [Propionicimonas sp.]|uniref:helix-turn-helix domain-containing protein n=1 Tax=Propionicimonas sp. TaxID=1955623 RepID=UPI003D0AC0B0